MLLTDDTGTPLGDVPTTIVDNGSKTEWIESAYLQDEWKMLPTLTLNYGAAVRPVHGLYEREPGQPATERGLAGAAGRPRVHAGYSRYLSPPPFELVGGKTIVEVHQHDLAAVVARGHAAAARTRELLRHRRAAESHSGADGGPGYLFQAIGTT